MRVTAKIGVLKRRLDFKQPIIDNYEHQGHPYFASARLWDDGVIDPADTRMLLGLAISASHNREIKETKFGGCLECDFVGSTA